MLRLTKETDYGILVLACLARADTHEKLSTKSISEQSGVSYRMVCKILNLLMTKQLLISHRGIKGGYTLAKSASSITLEDAISALEGPIALTECSKETCTCQAEATCFIQNHWSFINRAFKNALSGITLSAMVSQKSLPMFMEHKNT